MKKKMKSICSFFAAMMAVCSLFIGCSEKDNQSEEKTPATLDVKYSFTINQDYLNLMDATVTFWNEKGVKQTEPLTTTSWVKVLKVTQTQELGFTVNGTPKSNIDELLTAISYKMDYGYLYSYISSNSEIKHHNSSSTMTVSKDNVKEYIIANPEIYKCNIKWNKDTDKFAD